MTSLESTVMPVTPPKVHLFGKGILGQEASTLNAGAFCAIAIVVTVVRNAKQRTIRPKEIKRLLVAAISRPPRGFRHVPMNIGRRMLSSLAVGRKSFRAAIADQGASMHLPLALPPVC